MMIEFQWINNTAETDRDISKILLEEFDKYSESVFYGTPVCRGAIIRFHGNLINAPQQFSQAPLIIEYVRLMAKHTNAPKLNINLFNSQPHTTIEQMTVSIQPFQMPEDLDGRLITAQSKDTRRLFFPVSNNVSKRGEGGTRVTDMINVVCIEQSILRSWVENVGSTDTDGQFIQAVERSIRSDIARRLNGLKLLDIKTVVNGNQWSTEVHYGVVGDRRTMVGTVVTHRS